MSCGSQKLRLPALAFLLAVGGCAVAIAQPAQPDATVREALQQGGQAMAGGHYTEAVADYAKVTHSMPQFAEGYLNLGLALQQAGEPDAARAALLKALALKPEIRGANLFLGVIAYRQNHYKDAESSLLRETRMDPHSAKAFMWLGVCYLAAGKPQSAIQPLDKAYALDPADNDILYHRGQAYLQVSNASFAAMFSNNRDSMRVHQVLAEAYATGYRTQQAIGEFELTVKMAPRESGLHEELGDQYWVAGQLDKAADAYREGVGLMNLSQNREAIQEFERAIAADPKDDRAMSSYYKLALLYRKLDDQHAAQDAMQDFLRMKSQIAAQQNRNTAQIVRDRASLPVEDPERALTAEP